MYTITAIHYTLVWITVIYYVVLLCITQTYYILYIIYSGVRFGCGRMCSRCPWLSGCQGCLLPYDSPSPLYILQHINTATYTNEMIAIDWSYTIYEEFVNESMVNEVRKHSSYDKEQYLLENKVVPFKKCLDKVRIIFVCMRVYCVSRY